MGKDVGKAGCLACWYLCIQAPWIAAEVPFIGELVTRTSTALLFTVEVNKTGVGNGERETTERRGEENSKTRKRKCLSKVHFSKSSRLEGGMDG